MTIFRAGSHYHAATKTKVPQEELQRLGGTEAAELCIWFAMRGALSASPREVYSYYTFPKITGCGVIAFEET